ncbi:MAG: MBL fold metallo-hydrolase [Nannocystaceae bacterium]
MFSSTFLGHQGWLFSTESTRIVLDPLLTPAFGHGGHVGEIYPARHLDFARFPAVDAVILTHEHDDHFDIPSLSLLDREIPIYLSSRASAAAFSILREMGFVVRGLLPEREIRIGDLRYRSLVGCLNQLEECDEWDVFPFALYDVAGHGSFVSAVDAPVVGTTWEALRGVVRRPGLFAYANNFSDSTFQRTAGSVAASESVTRLAAAVGRRLAAFSDSCVEPLAILVCGSGWSFGEARAWMNARVFPIANEPLAGALARLLPHPNVLAVVPGDTLHQRDGLLSANVGAQAFVCGVGAKRWPPRPVSAATPIPRGELAAASVLMDLGPVPGQQDVSPTEVPALLRALDEFAAFLYGRRVFCQLHSLATEVGGYRAALCFDLPTHGPSGNASGPRIRPDDLRVSCRGTALCAGRVRVGSALLGRGPAGVPPRRYRSDCAVLCGTIAVVEPRTECSPVLGARSVDVRAPTAPSHTGGAALPSFVERSGWGRSGDTIAEIVTRKASCCSVSSASESSPYAQLHASARLAAGRYRERTGQIVADETLLSPGEAGGG